MFLALSMLLAAATEAAVPHVMNYQGKATDKAGAPLNGDYKLTFRIYNSASDGAPKWTEVHEGVAITNGIFQLILGSVTPLELPFNEDYWLSIEVGSDGEMSPRSRLASVGYAYRADAATTAESASIVSIPLYIQGFELEHASAHHIKVLPGAVDIDGRVLTAASSSSLINVTDSANYITGHANQSSWIYVYLYNNNNTVAYRLADAAPDKSDSSGNTDGIKRYYIQDNIAYRCIGAVRKDAAGNLRRFFQNGNLVMWDVPAILTVALSTQKWSDAKSCAEFMPSISTLGIFGTYNHDESTTHGAVFLRPNDSTWSADYSCNGTGSATANGGGGRGAGQRICATDGLQKIQYWNQGSGDLQISVQGYYLNIR